MKGTYNLCRGCMKWMEHKYVGEGEGGLTGTVYTVYTCVNCGRTAIGPKSKPRW